ncbi:hypothetical protein NDU88_004815 [Pleurodeles waltl]|uniref:Uncharacterized protein n=1 Tax=Pleurodeles waltl TaxID=8319 RepID=A0AAV7TAP7_PLEWA|nr:hypothetical protein NDU88_004815 [Pleurodeles waltl]
MWHDATQQIATWSRLPLIPTPESCILGTRRRRNKDKQKHRCTDFAFVTLKRLIATQWKSPGAQDIHRWTKDLTHWTNAEIQVLRTLRDIGIEVKDADIWDTFLDQLQEKDDTRPP